jgi:chromosomal replication initiation ATPase DnaA
VATKHKIDKLQLLARGKRGIEARSLAMWLIWETGTKSLREIGEMFGGLDYAAVNQRIRRIRSAHTDNQKRRLLAEMFNVET